MCSFIELLVDEASIGTFTWVEAGVAGIFKRTRPLFGCNVSGLGMED